MSANEEYLLERRTMIANAISGKVEKGQVALDFGRFWIRAKNSGQAEQISRHTTAWYGI
jgi:hypothetical protein